MGAIDDLETATARYHQANAVQVEARKELAAAMIAALRAGERPADVAAKSPFTETYVRRMARDNDIPEYLLSRHPQARAELEATLPCWRSVVKAIADLKVGLDDAEYVGGVLWYGLMSRGARRSTDRQKRMIVNRLTRWAVRRGCGGGDVARALNEVLDRYF